MAAYDVFISYRHTDAEAVAAFVAALRQEGLEAWLDEQRIDELASIQDAIEEGLGTAKVLVAWYSAAYPESRPCQWEFTTALLVGLARGQAMERILVVNPEKVPDHILPEFFRDQKYLIPGARDLQGQVLNARRRILGVGHLGTTLSSWNLFISLPDLQEMNAAGEVLKYHLVWLWQAKPNRLAAVQTKIRQNLVEMFNQKS